MTATRGASAVQAVPWDTINLLRPFFDKGPDPVGARLLDFPMLRGAWVAGVTSAGVWVDASAQARPLAYNGNPTFNYDGLVPYWDYDGTGDYHSRPDEAGLDILGTETYVAAAVRGMTMGGWFWSDATPGATQHLIGKYVAGVSYAYRLSWTPADLADFRINSAAPVFVTGTVALSTAAWHCLVVRFRPSVELKVYYDDQSNTNVVGIPAALNNTADAFNVGGTAGGAMLDGRASCCFLCAAALSDTQINVFYQMTKRYFGH